MQGIVKWFSRNRGFGFIKSQGKDYFVHISELEKNSKLEKGDKVSFEAQQAPKGLKAVKVRKGQIRHFVRLRQLNYQRTNHTLRTRRV